MHDRKNWLFVGSQQAGERAAVVMSLIESAKLNGHDPWAYLKDVFERLPTLKQRDLAPPASTSGCAAIVVARLIGLSASRAKSHACSRTGGCYEDRLGMGRAG